LFKNKLSFVLLTFLLTVAVVLSGCTKDEVSPKAALQASMSKSSDIKSYNFKGSMKFEDFNFPEEDMSADEAAAIISTLKSAELSWTGAYKADPMMMEMNLKLDLKGDLAISFTIPIIMTTEKVWVKIPNIPMLPIPDNVKNKFVELDLKELAEQSGQTIPTMDIGKSQQLGNDILEIVFKHVEEETYLTSVAVKDAGLPADVTNVDQVIQFNMDKAQIEPFVKTIVEKIAPELIELLSSNEEYRNMLQLKPEDLEEAKKSLAEVKDGEIAEGLAEMDKELKSLNIKSIIGIDKDNYPVYTDAKIAAAIESEDLTGSFAIKVISQNTNINGDVKFEVGEPKGDDVLTLEELQEQMGGLLGSGGLEGL
jgi:flagellar motor protein MotB